MKKVAQSFAMGALVFALCVPYLAQSQKSIPSSEELSQIRQGPITGGGSGIGDPVDPLSNQPELSLEKPALYPNPGQGIINISGSAINNDLAIKVISLTGKVVFEHSYKASYFKNKGLDLSYLPNGIYLVQVDNTILKYKKL